MVVLSLPPVLDNDLPHIIKTCKPTSNTFTGIPVVDFSNRTNAKAVIVKACKEFGFFKVVNHGVPVNLLTKLEAEAVNFFESPQHQKDKSGPPNPFGYGNKKIGTNGDVGWVEYLLFCTTNPHYNPNAAAAVPGLQQTLRNLVNEYVSAVRNMACEVLEMIAEELQLTERDVLSRMIRGEESDSCFRLNHYPPCPDLGELISGRSLVGFGEHTDPQIMSVLRSNNTSGLQIRLKDGAWVSVPSDPESFFLNVGDSLQVMTNGRFRSVKHRVLAADNMKSRVSMIYFGGPPLTETITPLSEIMEKGEESLYKEFTWSEYKKSAYKTKLGDDRLGFFLKSASSA
ncbi:hypothetical protein ACP275_13G183100 [Erythranthe tilingii]